MYRLTAVNHSLTFTQGSAFLAVVNYDSSSAVLGGFYALLDGVRQVRAAGADVGAEHVRAVAFIVNAHRELHRLVGDEGRVAPNVDGEASNGGQEDFEIETGHQLGIPVHRVPRFNVRALKDINQGE